MARYRRSDGRYADVECAYAELERYLVLIVLRRKWGRWFHIRPIDLGVRFLNHLLCQLLNELLSLFRFIAFPGHCVLSECVLRLSQQLEFGGQHRDTHIRLGAREVRLICVSGS